MKGYCGRILEVDLTNHECKEIRIKDEVYENLLSGASLAQWWCYRHIPANADPLGPDNIVCLSSGLLTSTGSVITGRWMVITKSPSTKGIGEANCGGTFAPYIKACGYDMIAFKGKSENPVYLYCDNDGPVIKDASHIWGKDTTEAEEMMINENIVPGKHKPAACVIGPAGEKLSWMAGVCNDRGRIAARQGVGAVMGSKNLKGVCLAGTRPVSGYDTKRIKELSKRCAKRVNAVMLPPQVPASLLHVAKFLPELQLSPNGIITATLMGTWGTVGASTFVAQTGEAPIKNWGGSEAEDFGFSKLNKVDAGKINALQTTRYYCYSCVYGCGGEIDISENKYNNLGYGISHKPEYETQWDFTGFLLNDDKDAMIMINEYCNRMGIDSISTGGAVGMAIECYENGLLTKEDVGGLDLNWGNSDAIMKFVKMICERDGIGDKFADGCKRASELLGPETAKYGVQAGGMEPPMHDSRPDVQQATLYAIDATPSRHTTGGSLYYGCMHLWTKVSWAPVQKLINTKKGEWTNHDEEALKVLASAYYKRLVDGAGGCYFAFILGVDNYPIFDWLNAATGWIRSPDEWMRVGKRIFTMRQMFNIKHGVMPKSFRPHSRMIGEPALKKGKNAGKTIPIDAMMESTWRQAGFDSKTGIPLESTIVDLGLDRLLNAPEEEFIYG